MSEISSPIKLKKKTLKCLIANDEPLSLAILEAIFEKLNFEVVCARNGQQAYEKVLETIGNFDKMFDLVVLDLNMPIADGYEACKNIHATYQQDNMIGKVDSPLML